MATYNQEFQEKNSFNPQACKNLAEVVTTLQVSSYAHEYARIELESAASHTKREALLEKLANYQETYLEARSYLETHSPDRLEQLERELICQKRELFPIHLA